MYKIIHDGCVIDVVRNPSFIRRLASGHIAITDKSSAQGIVGSDNSTVYDFVQNQSQDTLVVTIEKINLDEFNRLNSLLNSDRKAILTEQKLIKAKDAKIASLSEICRIKITDGFTITLKDNKKYNFKLTTEDQLNLLNLENQLNSGSETFIYHSTGLPCMIFMREDMKKIIKAYRAHVLYHTTYFNTAKQYLNKLTNIDDINNFCYGTDISIMAKDLVIRDILREGGVS